MPITLRTDAEQHEYLLRSSAVLFSIFLVQAAETTIAAHNQLIGTSIEQGVIGAIVGISACLKLRQAIKITDHGVSKPTQFAAFSETTAAWLALMGGIQIAISLGNHKFMDAIVEGSIIGTALLLYLSTKVATCIFDNVNPQVSLWKIANDKVGRDRAALTSGALFGQGIALSTLSYYAYQRNEFGTFGGGLLVGAYGFVMTAKIVYDWYRSRTEGDQTHFPALTFLCLSAFASSAAFFIGALVSYFNGRPTPQIIKECMGGGISLAVSAALFGIQKTIALCKKSEETAYQPV